MAITKAKLEGNARHAEKLDFIAIKPYKEEDAQIRSAAAAAGESVQGYILKAIRDRMAQDAG